MEEVVAQRLIEAAEKAKDDIGWAVEVRPPGICIRYTWRHVTFHPFTARPIEGNFYTVESFTGWGAIERAKINPLLTAMDDLVKQKMEWVP